MNAARRHFFSFEDPRHCDIKIAKLPPGSFS
jgi:hypothetical protein